MLSGNDGKVQGVALVFVNEGRVTGVAKMNGGMLGDVVAVLASQGRCDEFVKMFSAAKVPIVSVVPGTLKTVMKTVKKEVKLHQADARRLVSFARQVVSKIDPIHAPRFAAPKEIFAWMARQGGETVFAVRLENKNTKHREGCLWSYGSLKPLCDEGGSRGMVV